MSKKSSSVVARVPRASSPAADTAAATAISERSRYSGITITDRRGYDIQASVDPALSPPTPASGYEGATSTPNRTTFAAFPTNSRREINHFTRKEIVRKIRALDANLGIYSRFKSKVRQHAVFKGITPDPVTKDAAWNELNKDRFTRWADNPFVYSIDGSRDMWEDQGMAAETLVGDGEYFEALVKSPNGAPMLQPLDVFEIESPWGGFGVPGVMDGSVYGLPNSNMLDPNGRPYFYEDGVRTNDFLRPIAYAVRELQSPYAALVNNANWREIPANSMIHIFKRRRQKQIRGLSWFYSGINNGIDALDINALIKGTAKLHSSLAVAVRKRKAEAGKQGISMDLQKILDADGNITRVDERLFRGALIQYLGTDEGIDLLSSDRPGENLLAFIEFLYRDIAIATGLPIEVIYNMTGLGGPAVRAVLEDAQWFFEMVQDTIVWRHSQRIYVWNTALALKNGDIRKCNDPQWWNCEWHGPAKLTVDLKYTADARIKLIKNGALSYPRLFEENGQSAKTEWTRQMDFLQWAIAESEKRDVPFHLLIEPTPGAVTNQNDEPPKAAGSSVAGIGDPGKTSAAQTINLNVDAKNAARRKFVINRPDGTHISGEMVDEE